MLKRPGERETSPRCCVGRAPSPRLSPSQQIRPGGNTRHASQEDARNEEGQRTGRDPQSRRAGDLFGFRRGLCDEGIFQRRSVQTQLCGYSLQLADLILQPLNVCAQDCAQRVELCLSCAFEYFFQLSRWILALDENSRWLRAW